MQYGITHCFLVFCLSTRHILYPSRKAGIILWLWQCWEGELVSLRRRKGNSLAGSWVGSLLGDENSSWYREILGGVWIFFQEGYKIELIYNCEK